jgi:hypothetical protein
MNEDKARKLAELLEGEAWPSGGNIWLVRLTNTDGKLVVFSDDMVCQYDDIEMFRRGLPDQEINLLPLVVVKSDGFPDPPAVRR